MPTEDGAGPGTPNAPRSGLAALEKRIDVESDRLGELIWRGEDDVEIERVYERVAIAALRTPLLAERSVALRRIAKRVVPRRLLPVARRGVAVIDNLSRRVGGARSARRGRS